MNLSLAKWNWADRVALLLQADAISCHPAEWATPDFESYWLIITHGNNYVQPEQKWIPSAYENAHISVTYFHSSFTDFTYLLVFTKVL